MVLFNLTLTSVSVLNLFNKYIEVVSYLAVYLLMNKSSKAILA